ncbi:hypothetical protein [Pontivivens ytuae]|uniref:Uncharacterized protein n=1 Tax=Pontivivens ytuae TaxID=2789856 RepID=A0A7S9LRT7_9RHOB|nr:hypothetical protein [Pontivivens ytuae]QPH54119.1 hypothetical protein I0K15_20495 [Pontivivens ytuae]
MIDPEHSTGARRETGDRRPAARRRGVLRVLLSLIRLRRRRLSRARRTALPVPRGGEAPPWQSASDRARRGEP